MTNLNTTPLDILQKARKDIIKEDTQTFLGYKMEMLASMVDDINEEINEKLIQAIENRPCRNTWIVYLVYHNKYNNFFHNIESFISFLNSNITIPKGFVERGTKSVVKSKDTNCLHATYITITLKEN